MRGPARVLIVDDAQFIRAMMREILDRAGESAYCVVGEAADGHEAVARFSELSPDIVTMDIRMPGMDGLEATRAILNRDPRATIVVCADSGDGSLVVRAVAAGARDFLVKPYVAARVLGTLSSLGDLP